MCIRDRHTNENGQDLDHTLAPNVAHDDSAQRHKGQQSVGLAVGAVSYTHLDVYKRQRRGLRLRPAAQPVCLIIASKSGTGAQRLCPSR